MKQSLCELKVEKAKTGSNSTLCYGQADNGSTTTTRASCRYSGTCSGVVIGQM